MKVKFIDYHGRRAGVFSIVATKILGRENIFSSGGLPHADNGSYQSESDLVVGRKYAEAFRETEIDEGGLVEVIENTLVSATNSGEVSNMDLVLPLHPHILECMQKEGSPTDKAIPLMRYLGAENEWFDAPDYTIQRALAEKGIKPRQDVYDYVSALTGRTAMEGSFEAFRLYAQDTIETTKKLIEKMRKDGLR